MYAQRCYTPRIDSLFLKRVWIRKPSCNVLIVTPPKKNKNIVTPFWRCYSLLGSQFVCKKQNLKQKNTKNTKKTCARQRKRFGNYVRHTFKKTVDSRGVTRLRIHSILIICIIYLFTTSGQIWVLFSVKFFLI